ncbi:exodeoxyribonuclease V, g chain [Serratia symbiotica str. 'Cinara cedri']|nr:exodeoxyribonuclease V, g chain [Serratia symbiotica str. 'Cinara cedri']
MFTVYHSNQLYLLKKLISSLIARAPLVDPFQQEVVLVQSPGMAQWLQIQLAEQLGIAANITFPPPMTFLLDIFNQVLSGTQKESVFSKEAITWKLMRLLPELLTLPVFVPIKHYLTNDCNQRKIYQLSSRLAELFSQYLIYRPNWLEVWQSGERIDGLADAQQWQAPLWARLVEYTCELGQSEWHYANLHSRFIRALDSSTHCPPGLPSRIFICGISTLPPAYLDVLQALSRYIDIHLMFTNPCRYYWGNIQDLTFLSRLQSRKRYHYDQKEERNLFREPNLAACLFNSKGQQQLDNPLLASWGKVGADYLCLLSQLAGVQEVDAFIDISADNMLHAIQHDILELENHTVIKATSGVLDSKITKRLLEPRDHSISLHLCHSMQREVEVLYDQLLTMLAEDPELMPRDIIVMIADIDNYMPYIQSVFGNASGKRYLPFTIIDSKVRPVHPVIKAFISLLNLPHSRFTAEEVLVLLEVPALASRFAIDKEGLRILRHWISESGIRWGLNDNNVRELDLPVTNQNTWYFGIRRMLLGYAMDSDSIDWQGILPYSESNGLVAELVGKLGVLINSLDRWRKWLSETRSLKAWLPLCRQIIDTFFVQENEIEVWFTLLEQQWHKIIRCGLMQCYPYAVPLNILRDDLIAYFNNIPTSQYFVSGAINFCTIMPMRSIPFKVVCLLGMNDGAYPRTEPMFGFNLMAQELKCGDRRRMNDDRYSFLEAIMSAQQQLYISFIGCSIQDNRDFYPSVLVTELLEYIEQNYCLPNDKNIDIESSAQRVREYLIKRHARMPFAVENFLPDFAQQSYAAEWLPAAKGSGTALLSFKQSLFPVREQQITLDRLRQFYRHPIRAFFRLRLGIIFAPEEIMLFDTEPFTVDNLSRYKLNSELLNTLIAGGDPGYLYHRACFAGELPNGVFGEIYWEKQEKAMAGLAKKVRAESSIGRNLELDININGIHISGVLNQVQDDGLLRWRPAVLSIVDGVLLWLEHLLYCYMGGTGISRIYGQQNTTWKFASLTSTDASKYISELIVGYQRGLCHPLLLLNKSGWAWLKECYNPEIQQINWRQDTQIKSQTKLLQVLWGNQRLRGEGADPYMQRVLHELDLGCNDFARILAETERYLLPIAQYNIA